MSNWTTTICDWKEITWIKKIILKQFEGHTYLLWVCRKPEPWYQNKNVNTIFMYLKWQYWQAQMDSESLRKHWVRVVAYASLGTKGDVLKSEFTAESKAKVGSSLMKSRSWNKTNKYYSEKKSIITLIQNFILHEMVISWT